jgi:hypothetical protein
MCSRKPIKQFAEDTVGHQENCNASDELFWVICGICGQHEITFGESSAAACYSIR